MDFYHDGMRRLQDRYEGREVADRLASNRMRTSFNDQDRACIETSPFFFLATSTPENVDCSFKGGEPGFVRVTGHNTLAWPDYDGNRMYRSLGNICRNPRVGLLFVRFDGKLFNGAGRLRISGRATIDDSAEAMAGLPGAKRLVRVTAEHIFTNCPRYIPKLTIEEPSVHIPRQGYAPPDPAWKSMPFVKDIVDQERGGSGGD
jgi:predicted pyridoxine 5'-phosphate oxidase superfamily flavin-nucleotide-binding protein